MSYPSTFDIFAGTAAQGGSLVTAPDHALDHRALGSSSAALQQKLGLGVGTPQANQVLIGAANNGTATWGSVWNLAQLGTATIKNSTLGTPAITGGTTTNQVSTGGTFDTSTFNIGANGTADIYYRSASGSVTSLGIGTAGQVLTVSAGFPAWVTPATTINLSRTSTLASFTTTSATYTDVTNYAISNVPVTAASDIIIDIFMSFQSNTTAATGQNVYQILQGGTVVSTDIYKTTTGNNFNETVFLRQSLKNVAMGTYTFKLQTKNNAAGTVTVGPGEMTVLVKPTS